MNVIFRVDASVQIGTGHVMRCLTLADELASKEGKITFICHKFEGNLCSVIKAKGYEVIQVDIHPNMDIDEVGGFEWIFQNYQEDAEQTINAIKNLNEQVDWLIVDHYALDHRWEKSVSPFVKKIMVIDDLANRKHECYMLLDQNYYVNMDLRYKHLVPEQCKLLLGPQFAFLRKEIEDNKIHAKVRDGKVNRIFVFFGGSDPTNETKKTIEAIKMLISQDFLVDVIVGQSNPNKNKIKKICNALSNFNYYCQIDNLGELMVNADLAIGAGGTTTWERCFLGLPAITIIVAENQEEITTTLAKKNLIVNLGWYHEVSIQMLFETIQELTTGSKILQTMSRNCLRLMKRKASVKKLIMEHSTND